MLVSGFSVEFIASTWPAARSCAVIASAAPAFADPAVLKGLDIWYTPAGGANVTVSIPAGFFCGGNSAAQTRTIARAEVAFFEPTKFTDVKDSSMGDYERTTYLDSIRDHILDTPGVVDCHDVHVWQLTRGAPVFTAHVVVDDAALADGRAAGILSGRGQPA